MANAAPKSKKASTKSPSRVRKTSNYNDLRPAVEQQISAKKKDGDFPRRYHLTSEQKDKIKQEADTFNRVPNPLGNRTGAYWGGVEALIMLGPDQWHSIKDVRDKMQEIMSELKKVKKVNGKMTNTDAWEDFYNKGKRDGASKPKDGLGRIDQNFKVLQRLPRADKNEKNPYGLKLAQFGMTIDIQYREAEGGLAKSFFRLNTTWDEDDTGTLVEPMYDNPFSKRGRGRKKATAADEQDEAKQECASISEAEHEADEEIVEQVEQPVAMSVEVEAESEEDDGRMRIPDAEHDNWEEVDYADAPGE